MGRLRIALGSLLGAAAIHLAFLACSGPRMEPSDGGLIDAAMDAMGMVGDAETRDAVAQEAGGSCSCPGPSTTTFSGGIDLGSGAVTPRTQGSRASVYSEPYIFASGDVGRRITTHASLWLPSSPFRYQVSCVLYATAAGQPFRAPSSCSVTEERDGALTWSGTTTAFSATLNSVSDTALELTVSEAAVSAMARTITVRDLRWRLSQPAGGINPPPAYQP